MCYARHIPRTTWGGHYWCNVLAANHAGMPRLSAESRRLFHRDDRNIPVPGGRPDFSGFTARAFLHENRYIAGS